VLELAGAPLGIVGAILLSASPAHSFPWNIDMYRGAAVQPLSRAPRVMPTDALPVHGEPPMNREMATIKLKNPLTATRENLAHGKDLFNTNCAVCHGSNAVGDGPVVKILSRKPADLVHGVSKDLPDGYIYGTIRNGGIAMPSYDDAMSPTERWQVVLYVRSLQHAGTAKAKAGP
jgi:mono/diheme cytochrome c family protein